MSEEGDSTFRIVLRVRALHWLIADYWGNYNSLVYDQLSVNIEHINAGVAFKSFSLTVCGDAHSQKLSPSTPEPRAVDGCICLMLARTSSTLQWTDCPKICLPRPSSTAPCHSRSEMLFPVIADKEGSRLVVMLCVDIRISGTEAISREKIICLSYSLWTWWIELTNSACPSEPLPVTQLHEDCLGFNGVLHWINSVVGYRL